MHGREASAGTCNTPESGTKRDSSTDARPGVLGGSDLDGTSGRFTRGARGGRALARAVAGAVPRRHLERTSATGLGSLATLKATFRNGTTFVSLENLPLERVWEICQALGHPPWREWPERTRVTTPLKRLRCGARARSGPRSRPTSGARRHRPSPRRWSRAPCGRRSTHR
jgi:hypothetical protein